MQTGPSPDVIAPAILGVIGLFYVLALGLACAGTIFWIVALVDACRRDFTGENEKLIWILIIAITGPIGALIYWFVGRPKGVLRA